MNDMSEKKHYRCSCGKHFWIIYDKSASTPGRRFKDLNGKPLPAAMKICECGKRLSLEPEGHNPLGLEI